MSKQKSILNLLLLIVGLACFVLSGCQESQSGEVENSTTKVRVAQLEEITKQKSYETAGMVTSQQQVKLGFKTGGLIKSIYTSEGRSVKAGDLLAQLNMSEHESKLNQAQTAVEKAQRDLERVENLHKDSVATLEQLQDAKSNLEINQSNLRIAQFNFEHASIKAPHDGRIVRQLAEPSELIGQGMPVFLFSTANENWVFKAGISESRLVETQIGDSVSVVMNSHTENPIPGKVTLIPVAIDPQASSFEIEITLEPTKLRLVSGFTGKAEVFSSTQQTFYALPPKALLKSTSGEGLIYVAQGQPPTAHQIPVKIESISEEFIGISSSELKGADVIIERQGQLKSGMQVEILQND